MFCVSRTAPCLLRPMHNRRSTQRGRDHQSIIMNRISCMHDPSQQAFWMMYLTSNLAPLKAVATPFIGSLANPTPVGVQHAGQGLCPGSILLVLLGLGSTLRVLCWLAPAGQHRHQGPDTNCHIMVSTCCSCCC
jgi:hypothetical protein